MPRPRDLPLFRERSLNEDASEALIHGDNLATMALMKKHSQKLIVTSPPYNIGKSYEKRHSLDRYVRDQEHVILACFDLLDSRGSICWQVGNHIATGGEVVPLDTLLYPLFKKLGMKLRNRIVWHFEHGLHCSRRFSGRYETILWFTKGDDYTFNLDAVRVPSKYPEKKHYKGPRIGQLSGNPLGKNPGDLWIIPNVKWNHIEKTDHPCQFPVELVERLVLSLTDPGDSVFDPYAGVGSTIVAAEKHGRTGVGCEIDQHYVEIGRQRILDGRRGILRTRPMGRPVYVPKSQPSTLE